MKTIQVRNVPESTHRELRRRAAEAGTSLSDYVLAELDAVARRGRNAEILLRSASRDAPITIADINDAISGARPSK